MLAGLAPGVHVAPPPPGRGPVATRMDVAGFVGIAAKGPLDEAVTIEGWPQFVATFGEFLPNACLAYAVRGFFDNGGRRCTIVRVAAPNHLAVTTGVQPADRMSSVVTDTARLRPGAAVTLVQQIMTTAAGVQPADRRASLVADAHGFYPGARVLLRQAGKPPVFAAVRGADPAAKRIDWQLPLPAALDLALPFALEAGFRDTALIDSVAGATIGWTRALDERFDLALPVALAAGVGKAQATLPDEAGLELLEIEAASAGQWGNRLAVRLATAIAAEAHSRIRPAPDPADRLALDRLVGLRAGATVTLGQQGAVEARRVLTAVDLAHRQVRFDAPLAGFDLAGAADGTKPIRLRRLAFALSVYEERRLAESFADLDLPPVWAPTDSPINRDSRLIRITRLPLPDYPFPDQASGLLNLGEARLEGGRDGIAMLRGTDLTGAADAAARRGLRQFEAVDEPAGLAIPDVVLLPRPALFHAPLEQPPADPCDICAPPPLTAPPSPLPALTEATPAFSPDEVRAVQAALVEHCESRGDRVAVLDPPRADGPDPWDLDALVAWRQRFASSYAVSYFPWVTALDPIAVPPERTRDLPPSGHALGQFALADAENGRPAPANRPLSFLSALPRQLDDAEHGGLNMTGINCLRVAPGRGIRIMGARTLGADPTWRQLAARRTVIRLKRMLARALRWAVFEPNGRALITTVVAQIEAYLESEWAAQRLTGASAEEAFTVRPAMNADDVENGRFILDIGVAPSVPAEFVILRLTRSEDRLDLAELSGPAGWPS